MPLRLIPRPLTKQLYFIGRLSVESGPMTASLPCTLIRRRLPTIKTGHVNQQVDDKPAHQSAKIRYADWEYHIRTGPKPSNC